MMHWGWYWKVKLKHVPRRSCSGFDLHEIDSFGMYNNYQQIGMVRTTQYKCVLTIPAYDLIAFLQEDNSLAVHYTSGSYIIPVERQPCNFGGYRYYFHCPICDKRMRKLYCLNGQYQCRKCGNLAYYSQRVRAARRYLLNEYELKERVKMLGGSLQYEGTKPPRMHKKTFQKLRHRMEYFKAKGGIALHKEIREWHGKKAEVWLDEWFDYLWSQDINKYETMYVKKS